MIFLFKKFVLSKNLCIFAATELVCIPLELQASHFLYIRHMNQRPRTIQEQLTRLKEKGMEFNDEQIAISYLARISYFRLKYYWVDMLDINTRHFVNGTSFNTIIDRYEFDKKLRNILFGAIEILEVGLRTKFITTLSLATNTGLWYLDNSLFENQQFHTNLVLDMKYEFARNSDPFVRQYILDHPDWDKNTLSGTRWRN